MADRQAKRSGGNSGHATTGASSPAVRAVDDAQVRAWRARVDAAGRSAVDALNAPDHRGEPETVLRRALLSYVLTVRGLVSEGSASGDERTRHAADVIVGVVGTSGLPIPSDDLLAIRDGILELVRAVDRAASDSGKWSPPPPAASRTPEPAERAPDGLNSEALMIGFLATNEGATLADLARVGKMNERTLRRKLKAGLPPKLWSSLDNLGRIKQRPGKSVGAEPLRHLGKNDPDLARAQGDDE